MKLKELPNSLWTAWKLGKLSQKQLTSLAPKIPVIISLTSIPSRLNGLHIVIRSLLTQNQCPEKIILWLHKDLQTSIPSSLQMLIGDLFEIHYGDMTCSHRKLVHSLETYPNKIIVTCDDDLMYNSSWLQRLYQDHLIFPDRIIAHECREITYDNSGTLLSYNKWKTQTEPGVSSKWMMPIGYGGVLYPPHILHSDVTRADLYLALAPRADDLWFKAMSYLKGTITQRSQQPGEKPTPLAGSQKISLKHTNVRENGNYLQWKAICDYYDIQGR
ncbi:MAG TPA: glycosyltransferase family 2 protein [Cellvibrio sp.]|nr:glycosyltransferase family 2 protein [Cellvibrio sp.]